MKTSEISKDEREYLRQMFCLLMRKDRTNLRLRAREREQFGYTTRQDSEARLQ